MLTKEEILAIDRQHIWHPYTQMKDYENLDPIVITKGEGVRLFDADGNMYYDTISSWWCNVHGHGHPALKQAICNQLDQLDHVLFAGITHPPAAEVIKRLSTFLHPSLGKYFFSDSGATATEIALKMAFQYWQNCQQPAKQKFIFLENSYHGDTVGSMSVGGVELYHRLYAPLRFNSYQAASPTCSHCRHRQTEFTYDANHHDCDLECFQSMEKLLRIHHQELAAVIVEPLMQGAGGISLYHRKYLKQLRALTEELNVLLIFDEVATGFGRTGTMFAYEQADVIPDFICLAKGLTGGVLPLSLTVTTDEIYQAFYSDDAASKTFFHGHTHTANALACAVSAANLKLFQEKQLPHSQLAVLQHFHQRLRDLRAFDFVGDIRYLGFIGAIDIVQSHRRQKSFPANDRIGFKIYLESLKHNLFLRPLDQTIYWFLPLAVSIDEIDQIMDKSIAAIERAIRS